MIAIAGMMSHRFLFEVVHPAVDAFTITPIAMLPMYAMRIRPIERPTIALVTPSMFIQYYLCYNDYLFLYEYFIRIKIHPQNFVYLLKAVFP